MNQSSFLRLALVLSDGQATTFKKNLLRIITLILAENYGQELTISEMVKKISEKYALDFAEGEIKDAIHSAQTGCIIETRTSKDPVYFTYAVSPNEYSKIQGKLAGNELSYFVQQFLKENEGAGYISSNELETAVCRFLYNGFNSDIKTVLSLMNYRGEAKAWEVKDKDFSDEEIISLNAFLNWPNTKKNELIFKYVSFCYEYCVMTIKKDKTVFASIFRGKEFYLDANIIFRLAGFNKAERRASVAAFLNKCKECGVKVYYSNFTRVEIDATLKYHVDLIKELLGKRAPISVKAMEKLSSKYANLDFYAQYVEWTKHQANNIGDYASFLDDLKRQVAKCVAGLKFKAYETFEQGNTKERFDEYSRCLTAFKAKRNKGTYEGSIKVDIENYFLMQKLTENSHSTSFFDEKYSFITADHAYIDWTREKMPGTIPLFVLPSVWYSIMLKYHGRTDDDYSSFCQFLNQRISEPYDELQTQKTQILARVIELDETAEIKEQIIFDIGERLSGRKDIIEDIEAFIEESHSTVTERIVKQAISEVEISHSSKTKELTEKIDKAEENAKEQRREGFNEGISQGRNDVFYAQAGQIVRRNKGIHIVLIVLAIISVIMVAGSLIIQTYNDEGIAIPAISFITDNPIVSTVISATFTILSILFSKLGQYVNWLSTDIETVKKKLEKKASKLIKNSQKDE